MVELNSPLNTADRKSVRAAEKAADIADRERTEVLAAIMSTAPGRRWVWEKMGSAHVFATSFSTDTALMAFHEGERNQGLLLLNDIMTACPDQFILAMREQNERRSTSPANNGKLDRSTEPNGGDQGPTGDDGDWEASGTDRDLPGGDNDPGGHHYR